MNISSRVSTLVFGVIFLAACSQPAPQSKPVQSTQTISKQAIATSDVVISQVYGGGGNSGATYKNDFVELFNRGSSAVSVTGWSVQYASATGTGNFSSSGALSGTLAPGQYFLVQLAPGSGGTDALPTPDGTGNANMSGTAGKVALVRSAGSLACNGSSAVCSSTQLAEIADLVGFGSANFFEGAAASLATTNTTATFRKDFGCTDTNENGADFETGAPAPRNTSSPVHPCGTVTDDAPVVVGSTPLEGGSLDLSGNISLTFSEPVTLAGNAVSISCTSSGVHPLAVSGGATIFTVNPDTDFVAGENCTLSLPGALVSDNDSVDPPDQMVSDFVLHFTAANACEISFTPTYVVQGSGNATPLSGTVTTKGVVVGDFEGASPELRGFYLQDATGDADSTTSDGLFIFNGNNDSVTLGDVVLVTGSVAEFQDQTQVSASSIVKCGPGSIAPTDVVFPVSSPDFLERYEGMLVRVPQTMYVTEHFQLGRFDQVVVSSNRRLQQPTNLVAPGAPANALQNQNNLNRLIVDDAVQNQNPDPIIFGRGGNPLTASNTLRGGDSATGMVGVLTYTWAGNAASGNAYRLRPLNALDGMVNFQAVNSRPSSSPEVGGSLKVVGMNLLNFFNTFGNSPACSGGVGGQTMDCRGANNQAEFDRQWPKTVAGILAMNADVIGINEIENDGYGADSAIAFLVDRLNAATAPGTYAFVDADTGTGQVNALGSDAIKVGMIYKTTSVAPIGTTSALNSVAFVNGGDGAPRNRASLAQAFEQTSNHAKFVLNVNHLKSKGSACDAADLGDGQANCAVVRTNAANQLISWLATDPTSSGTQNILLVGDYNSYAKEDPIMALANGGYTNLIESKIGDEAYSYVFDGQWGYLDYAFGSAAILPMISGVAEFHINADEPSVLDYNTDFKTANLVSSLYAPDMFRISDHDPVVVGLKLNGAPVFQGSTSFSVLEGGSVTISASGVDPDGDALSYSWDLNNDGVFETVGQSVNFSAVNLSGPSVQSVKVKVSDPLGLSAITTVTIAVQNSAPVISSISVSPETSVLGDSVTATITFSDVPIDAPFTCVVNFGDTTPPVMGTILGNVCTASHVYSKVGSFWAMASVGDKDGASATSSAVHKVIFRFTGFFAPVRNSPSFNFVNSGQSIPFMFSLSGNQGLNILASGSPTSESIACGFGMRTQSDDSDSLASSLAKTPGRLGLQYSPSGDIYTYVWKTDRSWVGTCRQFSLTLIDGSIHTANFAFVR